jgi:serine/threonine protein kinase
LPDDVLGKVRAGIAGAEREPAPREADALELGVLDDRFELIEWLGDGGMGTVYRARDLTRASDVAVKVLHRCDLDGDTRFAREVAALAALSDPGIVAYIAHGETPSGDHYLVTELLHGETLAQHLLREGRMPLEEALALGRAVAHTLEVAHARGLVHRDVKPSNVFLRDVDRARREQPGDPARGSSPAIGRPWSHRAARFRPGARPDRFPVADRRRGRGGDAGLHGARADPRGRAGRSRRPTSSRSGACSSSASPGGARSAARMRSRSWPASCSASRRSSVS